MIDRRLWERAAVMRGPSGSGRPSLRRYPALTAVINAAATGLIIAQALLVAGLVADLVDYGQVEPRRFQRELLFLLGIALARALLAWAQERYAVQAAGQVIADLRDQSLTHIVQLGPQWAPPASSLLGEDPSADGVSEPRHSGNTLSQTINRQTHGSPVATAIAATQGLDALEPYLTRYLPALLLTAIVTPAALVVIGGLDWIALAIVTVALPLIPLFMWLIGTLTAGTSERRLQVVSRLGAQVLDLLTGLPTLKAFGREIGPGTRVKALGDAARQAAMGTLRIAFLSSMVLELLTTIAVAMVAVSVGLRLVVGGMALRAGLAVIMLAPEVFNPLRQVAAQFHASTDGLAATQNAFAILDTPLPSVNEETQTQGLKNGVISVELKNVSVLAGDRATIAPANLNTKIDLSSRGKIVALVGPSGSGKSTTVLVLLGLISPDQGCVIVHTEDGKTKTLANYGLARWWQQVVWVPQRPALEGRQRQLSVGQRQQLALAEALQTGTEKRILILDEPTAHLDAASEQTVLDTLKNWRAQGKTAIVIAHRPALISIADQVIQVSSAPLHTDFPNTDKADYLIGRSVAESLPTQFGAVP